jgi:hypothetical protein
MGNSYIHSIAGSIMGQVGLTSWVGHEDVMAIQGPDVETYPQEIWMGYGSRIVDIIGKMGPKARGRILSHGVARGHTSGNCSYRDVSPNWEHNARAYGGSHHLTILASYVVVAAIVDIIRADVRKMREEQQRTEECFDRAMEDYVHCGPKVRLVGGGIPNSSAYMSRTSVTSSRSVTESTGHRSVRGTRSVTRSTTGHSTHK